MTEQFSDAIHALNELQDDSAVPKNVKLKISHIISVLEHDGDNSIKIDKALQELDEINEDVNIQAFTRTQLWNVVSLLESIKS